MAEGSHVPPFDAAHFGVEVTFQRVFERDQLDEVAPGQFSRQRRDNSLSGKTSANWIMRNRLLGVTRPYSAVNCCDSRTMASPYSARFSWRISCLMRVPICQWRPTRAELTARAVCSRAASINARTSPSSRRRRSPAPARPEGWAMCVGVLAGPGHLQLPNSSG